MRVFLTCAAAVAVLLAFGLSAPRGRSATSTAGCAPREATAAYTSFVRQAVASGKDLWGGELLRQRGGPTYAGARRFLTPLTQGMQWHGAPLTTSGAYYLPFSFPFTSVSTGFALHAADGSELIASRVGGPSLTFYVGSAGKERYGSCTARLLQPKLAEGYLPILQTSYTDTAGVVYHQESFGGRTYGAFGAPSVISFVRLTVDTRTSSHGATVRLVPWKLLTHSAADRLTLGGQTRLIVSDGAQFVGGVVRYRVPAGTLQRIYVEWLNQPSEAGFVHANETTYANARAAVVKFWQAKLSGGATFDVPEPAAQNAQLGILAQLIAYNWRYSVGNAYEELSYAESLDAAEIAAEYGYPDVAKSIIQFSLQRMKLRPWRFTAFRGAHILSTAAVYVELTGDRAFLKAETPALDALVKRIRSRQQTSGPAKGRLAPEPLSTDLEDHNVDSVPGQIEAIQALRALGSVWATTGYPAHAQRAQALATSIDAALRPALKKASKRLKDGSLFVPDMLVPKQKPFGLLTGSRDGSYWNLVMPYALESGWFPAHSATSRGILRYLLGHGSRMLGVPRTYARSVYGSEPGAGLAQVYGLGVSRFLADNDQPDQLVLTLYGMLAAGMTANTFVSGEAVSVLPLQGRADRSMFMPPNNGSNASYLGTLRELLVHEAPDGLELAFSTPRAWLADGKKIEVANAPTPFGKVSYTLERTGATIEGRLVLPAAHDTRLRLRVPAGERLTHVVAGSKVIAANRSGTIDLGSLHGSVTLRATVSR